MLAIFSFLFYGTLMAVVAVVFLVIFFKSLLMTMAVLRSAIGGIMIVVASVAIGTAAYSLLVPALENLIPTFQRPGDGGWGMGVDYVAKAATQVLPPIIGAAVGSVLIFIVVAYIYSSRQTEES